MDYSELVKIPQEYYIRLLATGWLDEWCQEDIETLQETILDVAEKEPDLIIFTLSEYTLDPYGFKAAEDYKNFMTHLFESFDIEIKTESIIVEDDENGISINVETPEGLALLEFQQEDEWLHDDFFDFINDEVLPAYGEDKIFYPLPPVNDEIEIVFQYPEVINRAINSGVMPDDEYFVD